MRTLLTCRARAQSSLATRVDFTLRFFSFFFSFFLRFFFLLFWCAKTAARWLPTRCCCCCCGSNEDIAQASFIHVSTCTTLPALQMETAAPNWQRTSRMDVAFCCLLPVPVPVPAASTFASACASCSICHAQASRCQLDRTLHTTRSRLQVCSLTQFLFCL